MARRSRGASSLLCALCAAAALWPAAPVAAPAAGRFDFETTPGRLSRDVRPARYALTLALDPQADRFAGEATIVVAVRRPLPAIVLHAHRLAPGTAVLLDGGRERRLAVRADEATETWHLQPEDGAGIPAGTHRLRLAYEGQVQKSGAGLYRAPYRRAGGEPAAWLATQLEAVFARMVFPAFDEPAFRSVFEISVRAPSGVEVVSNMPLAASHDEGGRVLHRFRPTPPMPAYLVAVAAGRFDALAGRAAGVPLRILAAPGKRAQGRYALESTARLLPWYTAYFGVPYALPKLDQLAVPGTRFGAMEDWGLISYAEDLLLFDPAASDVQTRRRIFALVAHEVAHQWFGNLVTAASWEEIWLNEAFATWLAEKAVHRFHSDWQAPLRRRPRIDKTMVRDAGPATRAIRSGAVPEDRVFDVFDDITYDKGGAVLSMLEQWIGPETFRRGIQAYMKAQRLSNATAADLWFHMGRAAGRDIGAVAASWTDQPGFPLVTVSSRCDGASTRVELAQQRFSTTEAPGGDTLWRIPVQLAHGATTRTLLLDGARHTVELPGCPPEPLLVNAGGAGFYRVAYAPELHDALASRFARLAPAASLTLLSDAFALAQAGRLPMAAWLDLVAGLPRLDGPGRPAIWATAREEIASLDQALAGTPAQAALRAAARALFAPELARLGWTPRAGEDGETEMLRDLLIRDLARYGDADVVARARALFDADEARRAPLPAALRASVVHATAMHADAGRIAQLVARLRAARSQEDRWLYLSALASVQDAAQADRVLSLAVGGGLPPDLATQLPGLMAEHAAHGEAAYRFVVEHWQALAEQAGPMFGARSWLLPQAAQGFSRREDAQRLVADQQRLAGPAGAAPAARIAATIELLAAVREREAGRLEAPLRALAQRLAGAAAREPRRP